EAQSRFEESIAMGERLSTGSRGVSEMLALYGLARIEIEQEHFQAADSLLTEALTIADERLRPNHRYRLAINREVSIIMTATGRASGALDLLQEVLSHERAVRPEPHRRIGLTQLLMAEAYLAIGDPVRAEQVSLESAANLTELPDSDWRIGTVKSLLGAALLQQGLRDEAIPLLEQGHSIVRDHLGPQSRVTRAARARLDAIENTSS
ncbi:MAG: hypothetical protein JSW51_04295, partial [Gemmatimonadota bacterium]